MLAGLVEVVDRGGGVDLGLPPDDERVRDEPIASKNPPSYSLDTRTLCESPIFLVCALPYHRDQLRDRYRDVTSLLNSLRKLTVLVLDHAYCER